ESQAGTRRQQHYQNSSPKREKTTRAKRTLDYSTHNSNILTFSGFSTCLHWRIASSAEKVPTLSTGSAGWKPLLPIRHNMVRSMIRSSNEEHTFFLAYEEGGPLKASGT